MRYFIIRRDNLRLFIDELVSDGYLVYGATRNGGYVEVKSGSDLDLDSVGVSKTLLKHILYPNNEVLYQYRFTDENIEIYDKLKELFNKKRVIFGLRACDLKAIEILDRVFLGKYEDPYYKARRENTLLIGVLCKEIGDKCFCYFVNSGPDVKANYDLFLTEIDDKYLVEVGSINGLNLIKDYRDYFTLASEELVSVKEKLVKKLVEEFKSMNYRSIDEVGKGLKELFESELWREYGDKCLACGRCNFVCPTCNCFNIIDELDDDLKGGKRVRVWDSCHFVGFTRVASGEVFRRHRASRVRQRIFHKYYYSLYEIGEFSCVGCGRCIEVCKANIDIRDILAREVLIT